MLNGFYLIWPFILQKSTTAPYKRWNFCQRNYLQKVSKGANSCADFKKVHNSCIKRRPKNKTVFCKKIVSP